MMVRVGNLDSQVTLASDDELKFLRDVLSFDDEGSRFRGGRYNETVQKIRLFDERARTFPTGFLPILKRLAGEAGIRFDTVDARRRPCDPDATADLSKLELRDYQLGALAAVQRNTRGILKLDTGAGKTRVAAAIVKSIPCRWLFLVHRNVLLDQTADVMERFLPDEPIGRAGAGIWRPQRVTVCTFQTLVAQLRRGSEEALNLLEQTEGLIGDECHVMPADTYYGVSRKCRNAYWRVGLSATPMDRGDRRSVFTMAALGTIIYELPKGLLVEQGVLARPKIRMVTVKQQKLTEYDSLTDSHLEVKDWPAVYEAQVVNSVVRNQAIVDVIRTIEKPCLLFVKSIKHGRHLVHALRAAGQQADFVYGTHGLQQRKTAMKELVRGQLDVLVASVIFNEGVDIPELRSVVIAAAGKSVISALQRVGRGMRTAKDKTDFQVVDFRDLGTESLADQSRARRQAYLKAGYEVVQQ